MGQTFSQMVIMQHFAQPASEWPMVFCWQDLRGNLLLSHGMCIICRVILHVIYWPIWLICIDLFEILLKQCLFTSQSCFNNDSFLLIGLLRLQYLSQRTDPRDRHFCVVPASWCKRCKRFSDLFEHRKVPKSQESLPARTQGKQTHAHKW